MQAPYTPPEGQAACPHCDAETGPLILERPVLVFAALQLRCQHCQGTWNEMRGRGPTERFWTPAVGETGQATHAS